jgi:anhydro-N-acetylmuramic acid kinase
VQIANPNIIALRTGVATVADFRRKDMAAGGHGAPLVPAFHRAVFHSPEKNRVIINIGGMANITVLPSKGKVTGFDTGPGNVLLDLWIAKHQQKAYDNAGKWARQGKINLPLLNNLLGEKFFSAAPPKSTGRELFNASWLEKYLAAELTPTSAIDVQTTLTALTAKSISDAIKTHAPQTDEIFICGGGAHNDYLISLLQTYTKLKIENTSALGIDSDWVEACAFAWLAKQRMKNKPGNLPDVTGAKKAVVLGGIYYPD